MKTFLVGFYKLPDGTLDSVETPVTGNPKAQYRRLEAQIVAKYPKIAGIRRVGSTVESHGPEADFIDVTPGMSIGQMFDATHPNSRVLGKTFFRGGAYEMVVTQNRGSGDLTLFLNPRMNNSPAVRFPAFIHPQRQITDLEPEVKTLLGTDGRSTEFRFRALGKPSPAEVNPPKPQRAAVPALGLKPGAPLKSLKAEKAKAATAKGE